MFLEQRSIEKLGLEDTSKTIWPNRHPTINITPLNLVPKHQVQMS